ncbi:hypothetical protein CONLIGDRAFT_658006 [Coniochaeta ligniaria NRRL 30616]|uniref:Uncharacterized protein n=1 Tax=Coniochaeta ligniaria NRRL 30616 TaxID=1408157 RepID=A0A1J7J0V3_9PEZI|nr:hypothetical protein CONLIGDRAFT_658006 [Coniochaeta ligniaria NRRL 30616]
MTPSQQAAMLDKTARRVAPWWEMSEEGTELMLSYKNESDHSIMHHDCQWMRPLEVWRLDNLPPMMFIMKAPNSHVFVNASHIEDIWKDHFDYYPKHEGVQWVTMPESQSSSHQTDFRGDDDHCKNKKSPPAGSMVPASRDKVLKNLAARKPE